MEVNKKQERYVRILNQLEELLLKCYNPLSRMSTINAVLHHKMDNFFWTGFYLLKEEDLIVGPYQGPVACMLLARNKGVCWTAVNEQKTIVVPDIHAFPGHITCDSRSNSEIAIPVYDIENKIIGVLDIDSKELSNFDDTDAEMLEKIVKLIYN